MKKILEYFKNINNKLNEDHISEYSAECAYFTILSFIPFIIFFLTLIQFTNIDKGTLFFWIREAVPSSAEEMLLNVVEEVYEKSFGTVSIAAIVALWSASKGFYYLSKGLRKIYNTEDTKPNILTRLHGLFYTLILIISLIFFLFIMVLGKRIHNLVNEKFETIGLVTGYILKIRGFTLVIVMFLISLMIYRFIPKHKQKLKTQVYGALFVGIAWYVISWCFSTYIDVFDGFRNTYGSLTSIILIMMWVYVCMFAILLGGEINVFISEYKKLNKRK